MSKPSEIHSTSPPSDDGPSDVPPRTRRAEQWFGVWAPVAALIAVAVPLSVLAVQQLSQLGVSGIPCCDWAVLELGTRAFLRGEQLMGLYSREGWRHPGPAPFLWTSPFRLLPGRSFAEHQVSAVVLGICAVGVVVFAVWRRLGRSAMLASLTVVAVWMARFGIEHWSQPWNPITAMFWVVITVVASAVYTSGGSRWWLLVAAAGGSMAVQTHVGSAAAIAVTAALVAFHGWRQRGQPQGGPRLRWIGLTVTVLWLLPLIDLVVGDHLLTRLVTDLLFSDDGAPVRRRDVAQGVVHIIGISPAQQGFEFGPASPFVPGASSTPLTLLLAVVGVALGVYTVVRRRHHPFSFQLVTMAGSGLVLTAVALTQANGPFFRYLLFPAVGLGLLIWVGGFVAVSADIRERWATCARPLVLAQLTVILAAAFIALPPARPPLARSASNSQFQDLATGVAARCEDLPDVAVVNVGASWPEALAVGVAIERCTTMKLVGFPGFIAGQPYEAPSDAEPNVYVGPPTEATPPGVDIAVSGDQVVRVFTTTP